MQNLKNVLPRDDYWMHNLKKFCQEMINEYYKSVAKWLLMNEQSYKSAAKRYILNEQS